MTAKGGRKLSTEPEETAEFRAGLRRLKSSVQEIASQIRDYHTIDGAQAKAAALALFELVRAEIFPEDEGAVTIGDTHGDDNRPAVELGLPGNHVLIVAFDEDPRPGEGEVHVRSGFHDRAAGRFFDIEDCAITFHDVVRSRALEPSIIKFLEHYAEHGYSAVAEADVELPYGAEEVPLAHGSGDLKREDPDEEPG